MSETNPRLQTGRRRQLIDEISKLTDTEEQKLRGKELSYAQIQAIYKKLTGKNINWEENKSWHVKEILKELDVEERRPIYSGNSQISVESLKAIRDSLQRQ